MTDLTKAGDKCDRPMGEGGIAAPQGSGGAGRPEPVHTQTYGEYLNALRLKLEGQRAKIEKAEEAHERNHRIYVKYKIETDAEIKDLRAKLERAREGFEKIANFENNRGCSWDASIARATLEKLK